MQPPLPAPTATGSFVKTPFPHLLVYALERRLTGTFDLTIGATLMARIVVVGGCPAKVRTQDAIHFLGNIMLELGMITPDQLRISIDQMQANPRLQGQILLEIGATDPQRLDAGLRAQVERKIEHLFGLSSDTMYHYYDQVNLLDGFGGQPTAIDPFPVLWRGVRQSPAWEHVDATLRRVGNAMLRASATAQFERFAFNRQELEAVQRLRTQPMRMVDLTHLVGPSVGQMLVYLLMIMKQVELIDQQVPIAPQSQPMMPGAMPPSVPTPSPSSGPQAFARVQLQRQSSAQRPAVAVVEEVVSPSAAHDERASSPGMQAPRSAFGGGAFGGPPPGAFGPPAGAFAQPSASPAPPQVIQAAQPVAPAMPAGPLDIGSMISMTIGSAAPPPVLSSAPPESARDSVPGPAPVPDSSPSSTPGGVQLTNEQSALKTKILERSIQITSQDYFQMLGVERDADAGVIQKAFFALAKVWHPDRLPPALVDVKDACSKVFTHLTEAHATLMDPARRQDYMTLLKDGGATPEDQAKIQSIIEAATEFQKAEFLLKRNPTDPAAHDIVRRCATLDPEQSDYIATLAWLDAQRPEWQSREKTLEKITLLDRCIVRSQNCERAYFYRGLLFKRIDEGNKALKDFKRAAEINPRNLDAMREVRLHNMRGGVSKPPPGVMNPGANKSKPPPTDTIGGLFGKLFKK